MNPVVRLIFLVYFITHIPITLCIDLQALLPTSFYDHDIFTFVNLASFLSWYTTTFGDHLMRQPPRWFQSFIAGELFLQLPFFFVAVYALWTRKNFIRVPMVAYGAHVATTVVPILAEFVANEKYVLCCVYAPYLVVPLWLMLYFGVYGKPFGEKNGQNEEEEQQRKKK